MNNELKQKTLVVNDFFNYDCAEHPNYQTKLQFDKDDNALFVVSCKSTKKKIIAKLNLNELNELEDPFFSIDLLEKGKVFLTDHLPYDSLDPCLIVEFVKDPNNYLR